MTGWVGVGGGRSTAISQPDNITGGEGRATASSMRAIAKEGPGECRGFG